MSRETKRIPHQLRQDCSGRIGRMTHKDGTTPRVITVGSRVRVAVPDSTSSSQDNGTCTGVVIEDYADMVIDTDSVGRDWGRVQRWAIALDDGRLIFANDDDLTAEHPASS